ncbi:MAG TPA: hypothetical protein VLT86_18135 [Vicinamibacterales bacterium]|nr:hypothetical protein [Vicinamibacterales bacterium]
MTQPMSESALLAERPLAELARLRSRGLVIGAVGLLGMAVGFLTLERQFFLQSYLIAFIFWLGISMGSMALLMVQYLSGGGWGLFARRVFEASARNLPVMAVLFLPLAFSLPVLYPWARPDALADKAIQAKAAYLNPQFFYLRAVLYFVIWMALTFTLSRWSKEQDDNAPRLPGPKDGRMRALSGPGLVLYMLTLTLMSVDWVLSLEPHFTSTIFGILMLGGQGLSTMAFTIIALAALSRSRPISAVASEENFHDLGKLMLAFVMLWAYFNVSQFIIIYQGNLPEEIPWYINRLTGPWMPVAVAVLVGHFVVPFSLLLSRGWKRKGTSLARIALFILVMRVIDITWTIGPIFRHNGTTLHWLDFAAVLGLGGVWLFFFYRNLGARALVPAHDPYFKDALAHGGH